MHNSRALSLSTLASENIRFSSLFAAGDVPSGEERGETDVFAGYFNFVTGLFHVASWKHTASKVK